MTDTKPGPCLRFSTAQQIEDWCNFESPDMYPYSRKPTCERLMLGLLCLQILEDAAPDHEPHHIDSTCSEQVSWWALRRAREQLATLQLAPDTPSEPQHPQRQAQFLMPSTKWTDAP